MRKDIMYYYMELVEFLGLVLGPAYEIVLYDLRREEKSIIAISNAHVSGRKVDTPLSQSEINLLLDPEEKESSYKVNYTKEGESNKLLRASTLYIRNKSNELVGLLCINFDDSNFKDLANQLMTFVHPNELIPKNFFQKLDDIKLINRPDNMGTSIDEITREVLANVLDDEVPLDRLNREERINIVRELNDRGLFMLKGAVKYVSELLYISEATIYRYLNKIRSSK